jgi:hypothetical protein
MTTLIHKIFGLLDESNKDVVSQIQTKEEQEFIKAPRKTLADHEQAEALLETKLATDPTLKDKSFVEVSTHESYNDIIPKQGEEYTVDREYEMICKVDAVHQTLVNKGVDFSDIRKTIDTLYNDLYSPDKNMDNSLWGAIAKEHNLHGIRTITAGVHPELYTVFTGIKDAKFGGLGDAHLYTPEMIQRWTQSGNILQFPKHTGGHVPREILYGEAIGSRVKDGMYQYYLKHNKIITGKYGGKLSGALYLIFAFGIILGRYELVTWREEQRQRMKYGLRLMDESVEPNEVRRRMTEAHQRWLTTYYEEEEEEEQEEDEE